MNPYIITPLPALSPPASLQRSIKARTGFVVCVVAVTTQFTNGDATGGVLQMFLRSAMSQTPLHVSSAIISAGADPRISFCTCPGTALVTSSLAAYYGATFPIPEMWFEDVDVEMVWIGTNGAWDNSVIVYREERITAFLNARARVRSGGTSAR